MDTVVVLVALVIGGGMPMAWAPWLITLPISSFVIWRHFRHRIKALAQG